MHYCCLLFTEKIPTIDEIDKIMKPFSDEDVYKDYDIVMVGPQVSYRLNEVKETTGLPCDTIASFDYAVANCPNIMKLAEKLYAQK